jgi:hypothetical protein
MTIRPLHLALSVITLITLIWPAVTSAGPYAVVGQGNQSCGKWTTDRREKALPALIDQAWIGGYMTAFNRQYLRTQLTDLSDTIGFIDIYCSTHPIDSIANAAEALTYDLLKRK